MIRRRCWSIFSLVLLLPGIVIAGPAQDRAQGVFNVISPQITNTNSLSNSFQTPILSNGGTMSNLSGTKTFGTSVLCAASNNYLTVTGSVGSNGETDLNIQFDSNIDGFPDTNQSITDISGYCDNGYIQCSPGTWNNCNYHMWQMNNTGLYTVQVPSSNIESMKNCGCANGACLEAPVDHLTSNLRRFATGIANTAQTYNSYFVISKVDTTADAVRFFGQDLGDCYSGSEQNLTGYFSNPTSMKSDGATASDTHSLYNLVRDSAPISRTTKTNNVECSIRRDIELDDVVVDTGIDLHVYSQGRNYIQCTFSLATGAVTCSTDGDRWLGQLSSTVDMTSFCAANGTVTVEREVPWYDPPGFWGVRDPTDRVSIHQVPSCANELTGIYGFYDTINSPETRYYLSRHLTYRARANTCLTQESVVDECSSVQTNPACTLLDETTDGTVTYRNGSPTGATVPSSTRRIESSYCSQDFTRDFFLTQRKYACSGTQEPYAIDMSHLREPTMTDTGATASIRTADGSYVSRSFGNPAPPTPTCTQSCKVRKTSLDVSVNQNGIASQPRDTQTRGDFIMKQCTNGTCPVGTDETMVEGCGCSNNFTDAILGLQMLRQAGKDLECSDPNIPVEECLGDIEVFKGRHTGCRTAGTQTAWRNCCDLGGKVFEEQYGNRIASMGEATEQLATQFDAMTGGNDAEVIHAMNELSHYTSLYQSQEAQAQVMNWLFSPCARDSGPAALIESDMCVYLGEECIEEWALVGCVQEREVYCCFKSMLGKILHEQGRAQFPGFTFGTIENPNCNGFTLEQFQAIDFSRIDFTELEETIRHNSQEVIDQNMNQGMDELRANVGQINQ